MAAVTFQFSKFSIPGCVDCVGEGSATHSRFSMPLAKLGEKKYYLGIFFKVSLRLIERT